MGSPIVIGTGWVLFSSGLYRMYSSLNSAYVEYERAALDLKTWEQTAKKVVEK